MTSQPTVAFGPLRLDTHGRSLTRDGAPVAVGKRALDVLAVADGRLVGKDTPLDQAWLRVAVAENNLHARISALRRALGAEAVATVPGRGYRLAMADGAVAVAPAADMRAGKPSVTVLPFASIAGNAAEHYFAQGLTD